MHTYLECMDSLFALKMLSKHAGLRNFIKVSVRLSSSLLMKEIKKEKMNYIFYTI